MLRLPVEGFHLRRSATGSSSSSTPTSTSAPLLSPELPASPPPSHPLLVPLVVPPLPSDPTHLLLTVRNLESDRYLQVEVQKEWKVSRLKKELLVRFGLVEAELERDEALSAGVEGLERWKMGGESPEKVGKGKEREGDQRLLGAELSRLRSNLGTTKADSLFFRRPKSAGTGAEGSSGVLAARKKSIGRAGKKVLHLGSIAFVRVLLCKLVSTPLMS